MTDLDESTETNESPATHDTDRRGMLRKLAIGGAGAAVAVTALGRTAEAAAEPGALELGSAATNTSTTATTLVNTPAAAVTEGPSALSVGGAVPAADKPYPANVGGYGNALVPHGLHGSTTAPAGFGVVAASLAPAAPAATDPVPAGLAVASLGGTQVRFVQLPGSVVGPTPGKHVAGELYADKSGTLWFTVPTAVTDVVRFVQLAGTASSGAYHAVLPQRAYDSRIAAYPTNGLLAPKTSPRRECCRRPQRQRRGHLGERRAGRGHGGPDQPDRGEPDRSELPVGGAGRRHVDRDIAGQLESRRDTDRQLDHGPAQRQA